MRVVLADDAALFRKGVANLLREAGFDVVGQAENADDLLEVVANRLEHQGKRRGGGFLRDRVHASQIIP